MNERVVHSVLIIISVKEFRENTADLSEKAPQFKKNSLFFLTLISNSTKMWEIFLNFVAFWILTHVSLKLSQVVNHCSGSQDQVPEQRVCYNIRYCFDHWVHFTFWQLTKESTINYDNFNDAGVIYLLRFFEKLRIWRLTQQIIIWIRIFLFVLFSTPF